MDSEPIDAVVQLLRRGKTLRMSIVALSLVTLTGCASIGWSVAEHVVDTITCHNKCPGGPGEKECMEKCRDRLKEIRKEKERTKKDPGFWPEQGYQYELPQMPASLDPVRQLEQRKK